MLRLLRQISLPELRASWGRTALVVGGIATGVSLIVGINIINTSVLANFQKTIELMAGPAALEVTLGVGEVGFPESTAEIVRADPDVAVAVPLVRGTIALADDPSETIELFGADLTAEEDLQRYQIATATSRREILRSMEDPRSILLTTRFADRHGLDVGQPIQLSTPGGVGEFTVRGLIETEGLAAVLGGRLAIMDLPAAQLALGKEQRVDQIDIVLRAAADAKAVRGRLERALPRVLTVAPPAQRGAQYEGILASFRWMLTGISTLCLVAGVFVVYNTTSTGAIQRATVMAGLRLIGADTAQLFRLLMLEALFLGGLGTLLGMVSGLGLARLLSGVVTQSMGAMLNLRFPVEALAVDGTEQLAISFFGVGAALFASYFAARRMSTLEPLEIIRPGVLATAPRIPSKRLVAGWLFAVAVSAAALAAEVRWQSIAWGNFGSTLWNASVIVIAIPLVGALAGILSRLLPRRFGAEGRVAADSLFRTPIRTGVAAAAIALVLTLAITLASIVRSARLTIGDYVEGFLRGDIVVSAVATYGGWMETPLPERVAAELREIPGVRAVETMQVVPGQMYRGERIGLLALSDGFFDPGRYPASWYREGDAVRAAPVLRAGEGVTVSTSFADRFGFHVGDAIELDTPTGPFVRPIAGIVPDWISERGSVIFSRRLLAEHWQDATVGRINVFLEPAASLEDVRGRIARRFADRFRLKVQSLREARAYMDGVAVRAFAFTDAIQILLAIVTVAGIFDLLLSAIAERRRELALWRLIGADEGAVRRSVVIESTTIGLLGTILGVATGYVTAWIWVRINFRILVGYYHDFHFALGASIFYAMLVVVVTALAGYTAASRAVRRSVLSGIQTE